MCPTSAAASVYDAPRTCAQRIPIPSWLVGGLASAAPAMGQLSDGSALRWAGGYCHCIGNSRPLYVATHSTQPFIAPSVGFSEHRSCVQSPQAAAKRGEEESRTSCSGTVVAPSALSRDHLNAPAPHSAKAHAMQQGSVFRAPCVARHAMRQNARLQWHRSGTVGQCAANPFRPQRNVQTGDTAPGRSPCSAGAQR